MKEALKLAIEALGAYMSATDSEEDAKAHSLMAEAFFKIKEALAQDSKRPIESDYISQVAYTRALQAYCDRQELIKRAEEAFEASEHEQPAPVQQEPVNGCVCRWNSEGDRVVTCERHQGWLEVIAEWADRARDAEKKLKALNTSPPPQRTWVGLTDERLDEIYYCVEGGVNALETWRQQARAIEAAVWEKLK